MLLLFFPEVNCQRKDGYPTGVDECLKYSSPMPSPSEPCQLPCDDDCQFKEWGRWTECPFNCEGDQIRRRKAIGKAKRCKRYAKCNI